MSMLEYQELEQQTLSLFVYDDNGGQSKYKIKFDIIYQKLEEESKTEDNKNVFKLTDKDNDTETQVDKAELKRIRGLSPKMKIGRISSRGQMVMKFTQRTVLPQNQTNLNYSEMF